MLYQFYEWNHAALAPWRAVADATKAIYQNPLNPASRTEMGRAVAAMAELFERSTRVYGKPAFGLDDTFVDGRRVPVVDRPVWSKPFCRLLHFERALPEGRKADPRILLVAPMSGHYATLLRGTVEALLPYAEVYVTDWTDARLVPLSAGRFDLDDYVDHLIEILHFLGPDTHVVGVCQPAVPVLMAAAVMGAREDDCAPSSMTLMGGPIDTRINPTAVNKLAEDRGIDWFRDHVVMKVPFPQPGFMRDVYPGFLQLTGFMSMNLDRHLISHKDFFWHLVQGDGDSAEKHRTFYDEYNTVMDLTAEFYLQTVDEVFVKHSLPKGEMRHRGERVDPSKITRTALLTVEGEKDDISGLGQTEAAHRICSSIPEDMRVHYVQKGVGHYGVFNGSRFRSEIAPRIVDFALTHGRAASEGHTRQTHEPPVGRSVDELTDRAPTRVSSDSLLSAAALAGLPVVPVADDVADVETSSQQAQPVADASPALAPPEPALVEATSVEPSVQDPTLAEPSVPAPSVKARRRSVAKAKAKSPSLEQSVSEAPDVAVSPQPVLPEADMDAILAESEETDIVSGLLDAESETTDLSAAGGALDQPGTPATVDLASGDMATEVPASGMNAAAPSASAPTRQQRRKAKAIKRTRKS